MGGLLYVLRFALLMAIGVVVGGMAGVWYLSIALADFPFSWLLLASPLKLAHALLVLSETFPTPVLIAALLPFVGALYAAVVMSFFDPPHLTLAISSTASRTSRWVVDRNLANFALFSRGGVRVIDHSRYVPIRITDGFVLMRLRDREAQPDIRAELTCRRRAHRSRDVATHTPTPEKSIVRKVG